MFAEFIEKKEYEHFTKALSLLILVFKFIKNQKINENKLGVSESALQFVLYERFKVFVQKRKFGDNSDPTGCMCLKNKLF